ncbi:MAG: acetyl-CoA carboxylase carboxyl transferase subunit alpha, partial [Aestuariivirga sp.]
MQSFLDFEAPVAELEGKIAELRTLAAGDSTVSIADEVRALERKAAKSLADLYQSLTPWQKAQVARHPERPHGLDYVNALMSEFTPLSGDRKFADDYAI